MSLNVSKTSVSKKADKGIELQKNQAIKINKNLFICSPVPKYKLLACQMAVAYPKADLNFKCC